MPEKKGFRKALLGSSRSFTIYASDGKPYRTVRTYDVKLERLYRVVRRITGGLFFDQSGYRLPSTYGVGVVGAEELLTFDRDTREQFLGYMVNSPVCRVGNGVFSFQGFRSNDDRLMTGWRHVFYDRVEFLAATLPLEVTAGP